MVAHSAVPEILRGRQGRYFHRWAPGAIAGHMMGLGSCDSQVSNLVSETQCSNPQASVLCFLSWDFLSSHSLHWCSEPGGGVCSDNNSVLLCQLLSVVFFLFFSCRYLATFQKYKKEQKGSRTCTPQYASLAERLFWAYSLRNRHRKSSEDRVAVCLLWGTFTLIKKISIYKDVSISVDFQVAYW